MDQRIFKLIFLCLSLGVHIHHAHAQEVAGSCIVSRTKLLSRGTKAIEQRVYDNGLGDVIQETVSYPGSNIPGVIVHHEYDEHRRKTKTWLPVTSSTSNYMASDMLSSNAVSMYSDTAPFSHTEYDSFLQSQPSSLYKAGTLWQNQGKKTSITYVDTLGIGLFTYDYETIMRSSDIQYLCTKTVDEDGCMKAEYTDTRGHLLVSETSQGKTFYIYDLKGDLLFVIPPTLSEHICGNYTGPYEEAVDMDDEMMDKYAYCYRYDNHRRYIYKKLPGCDPIYYVYDKAGNCILTQDGKQRQSDEWTFSIPDKFGRPCVSGICYNSIPDYSTEPLQSVHVYAEYDGSSYSMGGYTIHNLELESEIMYSATYYDNYSFIGHHGVPGTLSPTTVSGYSIDTSLGRGLQTGSATAVIEDCRVTGYTYSSTYYDSRYNVAQVIATNHLGNYDITSMKYSFTGKLTNKNIRHNLRRSGDTETYLYTYDYADRLETVKHTTTGGSEVILQSNTYNSLGQLTASSAASHTTSYTYDMHSWLTSISAHNRSNLFQENLMYANSDTPCFNGNISSMSWKAGNTSVSRGYSFEYDDASRLTYATYNEGNSSNNKYGTQYTYDAMGNITSLIRNGLRDNGSYNVIDNLTLNYNGNQLISVTDTEANHDPTYNNAWNFTDGSNSAIEYEYDENGNLTKDLNRKILSIQYNSLNLPSRIDFTGNDNSLYSYSADGRKLKAEYRTGLGSLIPFPGVRDSGGERINDLTLNPGLVTYKTIDYVGNLIYENGVLKQMLIEGGYITFDSNATPVYHFYVKDHLGNNRVVVHQGGTVEQVNHYYPYGGLMAESTGWDVQRYKFGGKELDRMHGLDWYDYGARWMDASIGRWHSVDPLCEQYYDVSPYNYCINNPLILVDCDGRDPGSFFKAKDDAARDFGRIYNPLSITYNIEYGASIFKTRNFKGEIGYTYTVPLAGTSDGTNCSLPPFGIGVEAQVHSHGASIDRMANNVFSGEPGTSDSADLDYANKSQIDIYLAAPNGTLRKYEYKTQRISIIDNSLPNDVDGKLNPNDYEHSFMNDNFGNKILDEINVFVKGLLNILTKSPEE